LKTGTRSVYSWVLATFQEFYSSRLGVSGVLALKCVDVKSELKRVLRPYA